MQKRLALSLYNTLHSPLRASVNNYQLPYIDTSQEQSYRCQSESYHRVWGVDTVYCFNTGVMGEVWAIKNDLRAGEWNIRVSVRSLNLALNGYEKVKESLLQKLKDFDAYLPPKVNPFTGETIGDYEESIGRV